MPLCLHLTGGSARVEGQLLLGRGAASCPEDPYLSRQHCIVAYDDATGSASVTWMGRRFGRLCTRRVAFGVGRATTNLRTQVLNRGAQRRLSHGDLLVLLGETGRHPVLVALGDDTQRPSGREWAAIEATAVAAAENAVRAELLAKSANDRRLAWQKVARDAGELRSAQAACAQRDGSEEGRADAPLPLGLHLAEKEEAAERERRQQLAMLGEAFEAAPPAAAPAAAAAPGTAIAFSGTRTLPFSRPVAAPRGAPAAPAGAGAGDWCWGDEGDEGDEAFERPAPSAHRPAALASGGGGGDGSGGGGGGGGGRCHAAAAWAHGVAQRAVASATPAIAPPAVVGSALERRRARRAAREKQAAADHVELDVTLFAAPRMPTAHRQEPTGADDFWFGLGLSLGEDNAVVAAAPGSAAAQAGLLRGDVILRVDGEALGARTLQRALVDAFVEHDAPVRLGVRRAWEAHRQQHEREEAEAEAEARAASQPPFAAFGARAPAPRAAYVPVRRNPHTGKPLGEERFACTSRHGAPARLGTADYTYSRNAEG